MSSKPGPISLTKGNEAIAKGALAAGLHCYFAYPITPQSDIPEYLSKHLVERGGEFIQAESEIASVNMLLGAAACGKRAMTSSSSPGIALKQEGISYMAGSELPAVIVNISRGGPGLGSIDPSQGDYYQATRGGGHGDYRTLVLAPSTCQEAYDLTIRAFELAFYHRNPVVILGDAILGQMKEPLKEWEYQPNTEREAADWALSGAKDRPSRLIKSLYLADEALAGHNERLQAKHERMRQDLDWEEYATEDSEVLVVAFGSVGRIAKSSVRKLRSQGYRVGLLRPITLFPFPEERIRELAWSNRLITIENNTGQMVDDVRLAARNVADSAFFGVSPGRLPSPEDFLQPILEVWEQEEARK
ncbi:MAG: 3-methyl-2-oxobutanoate dehydrogenase subunit VorB [Desulfohalobiaceae bacterium]|nr:3-methyl-2-oxobutanoate dehydrogenase subunit VorB [Desulfohalobiaceae bacterium]